MVVPIISNGILVFIIQSIFQSRLKHNEHKDEVKRKINSELFSLLLESKNNFRALGHCLTDHPESTELFKRISFKQNQITKDTDTKKALKMIDARDIVSIICMFNIDKYNSAEHPTKAYSGKQAMLNEYLDDPEHYRKFVNVIPDLFDLYDAIETEFAVAYNENGRMYGRKSYSGYKEGSPVGKSKFCMSDIYYKIPDGLLYPILAAFRVLLEYDITSGKYKWMDGKDPIAVWNKHKVGLTRSVMDLAGSLGDKPTVFGKDPSLWNYAYMVLSSMEGISLV